MCNVVKHILCLILRFLNGFFLSFNLISASRRFIMYLIYIRIDDRNFSDRYSRFTLKKNVFKRTSWYLLFTGYYFLTVWTQPIRVVHIICSRSMSTRLYQPYKYYRTLRSESVSIIYEFIIVNIIITYAQAKAIIYYRKGFRLVMNLYNWIHRLFTDDNNYYTFVNA